MPTKKVTSKEYFKILDILYFSLLAGQIIFALITLYLNLSGTINAQHNEFRDIFLVLVPIFVAAGIYASHIMYKNRINITKEKLTLIEKMSDYRSALLLRWALLEFPSFFSIIAFFLTGDFFFLGITALIIVFFINIKPNIEKASIDLELSIGDKMAINDPDAIIAEININE
jgi:hypothetical protein